MKFNHPKVAVIALLFMGTTLTYCTSTKKTTTTPTPVAGAPTYSKDVAPAIAQHCGPCHFPSQGGKVAALDNYNAVKKEANDILYRINKNPGDPGFMPAKHDKLSAATIATIQQWKDGGLQE